MLRLPPITGPVSLSPFRGLPITGVSSPKRAEFFWLDANPADVFADLNGAFTDLRDYTDLPELVIHLACQTDSRLYAVAAAWEYVDLAGSYQPEDPATTMSTFDAWRLNDGRWGVRAVCPPDEMLALWAAHPAVSPTTAKVYDPDDTAPAPWWTEPNIDLCPPDVRYVIAANGPRILARLGEFTVIPGYTADDALEGRLEHLINTALGDASARTTHDSLDIRRLTSVCMDPDDRYATPALRAAAANLRAAAERAVTVLPSWTMVVDLARNNRAPQYTDARHGALEDVRTAARQIL